MNNLPRLVLALTLLAAPLAPAGEADSPLHMAMATMGKAFRGLNRGLRAPDPALKAEFLARELAAQRKLGHEKYDPKDEDEKPR